MSISNGVPATAANLNAAFVSLSAENTFPEEQTYEKGLLVKEIATPATPASGYLAVYAKTDGEAYVKNDAGTETQISNVPQTRIVVPPTIRTFTSGSGTYYTTFNFAITSGSATVGATYTNNGNTYTVLRTIASQTYLACSGTAAPTASGTLTKSGGTGDSTITFSAVYKPSSILVRMVGGGGGGGGSGTASLGVGGAGGNTTFDTTLLIANGAAASAGQTAGGIGGSYTITSGILGYGIPGGDGCDSGQQVTISGALNAGGNGGNSYWGGGGSGGNGAPGAGTVGATNSGAGGGGAGAPNAGGSIAGAGGGAGGFVEAWLPNPNASYAYSIGTAGSAGGAGTSGAAGAAGAAGIIVITEVY